MSRESTLKPIHHRHKAIPKSASTTTPASSKYQQKAAATAQQKKEKDPFGKCTCDFKIGNEVKSVTYDVTYTDKRKQYYGITDVAAKPSQAQREALCAKGCREKQAEMDARNNAKSATAVITTTIAVATVAYFAHRLFRSPKQTHETNPTQQKSHHMKR